MITVEEQRRALLAWVESYLLRTLDMAFDQTTSEGGWFSNILNCYREENRHWYSLTINQQSTVLRYVVDRMLRHGTIVLVTTRDHGNYKEPVYTRGTVLDELANI